MRVKPRKPNECERCGAQVERLPFILCAECRAAPLTPRERFSVMLCQTEYVQRVVDEVTKLVPQSAAYNLRSRFNYDARFNPDRNAHEQLGLDSDAVVCVLAVFAPDSRWRLQLGADRIAEGVDSLLLANPHVIGSRQRISHDGAEALAVVIVERVYY